MEVEGMESENWSLEDLKENECPICKIKFKIGVVFKEMHICTKCFDKLIKEKEGKEMGKTYSMLNQENGIYFDVILKEDYLKVVEETGRLWKVIDDLIKEKEILENIMLKTRQKATEQVIKLEKENEIIKNTNVIFKKEIIESDENCVDLSKWIDELKKELKEKNKELLGLDIQCESLQEENRGLKEHIEVLTNLLNKNNEEKEDTYTLIYAYWCEVKQKQCEYKQEGLLKEEYEEMYGMDSDSWLYHALVKEVK